MGRDDRLVLTLMTTRKKRDWYLRHGPTARASKAIGHRWDCHRDLGCSECADEVARLRGSGKSKVDFGQGIVTSAVVPRGRRVMVVTVRLVGFTF